MADPATNTSYPGEIQFLPAIKANDKENDPGLEHDVMHDVANATLMAIQRLIGTTGDPASGSILGRMLALERSAVTVVSSASGVVTLDYAEGDYFQLALTENVASWVIANPPGSGRGFTLMVEMVQATTPHTVADPGTTAGGAPIQVSKDAGAIDVLAITSFDNGTTLRSSIARAFA